MDLAQNNIAHREKETHGCMIEIENLLTEIRICLRFLSISSAKSCGRPNDIPNGKIIGFVHSFKEKIRYECNEGYNLKGPSYRTCQANEKWGDKDPICEGKIFYLLNVKIIFLMRQHNTKENRKSRLSFLNPIPHWGMAEGLLNTGST